MTGYTAGTVSARIELDTSDFDKEVKSLQGKIDELKLVMSDNGLMEMNKQIKELQEKIKLLSDANADYKRQLKSLRTEKEKDASASDNQTKKEKEHQKTITETINSLKKEKEVIKEVNNEQKKTVIPKGESEIDIMIRKREKLNRLIKEGNLEEGKYLGKNRNTVTRNGKEIDVTGWQKASEALEQYEQTEKRILSDAGLYSRFVSNQHIINEFAESIIKTTSNLQTAVKPVGAGFKDFFASTRQSAEQARARIGLIADELKAKFHSLSVELAHAKAAQYQYWQQSRGSVSGFGEPLQIKGYNDYLKVINQVNKELDILARKQRKASGEIGNWNKSTISLNTYKSKLTEINKELDRQAQRVQKVKNAQLQLQYFQRTDWLNQYKGNMKEINTQLERQTASTNKTTTATKNLGRGITSFNNGVVQTAHSGRILSNTLYQIRGALLSLKMIFTAMGGMALWGFATDIAEGVKETFRAKNEMEAQLRQNSKVSKGGIAYFNNELDKLTDKFKKINKYSIGETVSSIGLEFNLSAKQMADFSDIVAMIQSEYVRAGRKESEAALAVKDILQGEFQRLSRETGVGKEELIAYGWNEDKTDIESLTDALRKAALDRHWDVFAKKATSLNDVMTIMKSRFSETGADLMQASTPLIVGAFNEIINAIEGLGNAWNSMGSWNRSLLSILSTGGLIGGIGVAIPMITKGMGLAQISTIGFGKSILTAALNLNKLEVAHYGVRKAIAAVITGQKAEELATTRSTKAIMGRILGLNQSTLAEKGYLTALVKNKMELSTIGPVMSDASIASLKWYQKLGFLSGGLKETELANAGLAKSLTKTIFSMKALKLAITGIMAIGIAAWLAGVMYQADMVKKRIDTFNDVLETGNEKLQKQQSLLKTYADQMEKYGKNTNEYKRAKANHDLVQENIKDLQTANRLVKSYDKQNKLREESIKLDQQRWKKQQLINAGLDEAAATEKASAYSSAINQAQYELTRSYNKQYEFLAASSKHINEYVAGMKKAGVEEKDRVKYINEYNLLASEAGEHIKEFYQGNASALAYYAWDRIKMAWLDISSHPEVAHLMQTLGKTWESWQPTLKSISEALTNVGLKLSEFADWFLQSDLGKQIALYGTLGTVVGFVGLKMAKWVTGSKSVFETLKNLKDKLKDVSKWWKDVGDKAEEANDKMGGDTPTPGETEVGGKQWKKGEFWKTIGDDAKNTGRTMFKYMGYIAAAMAIVAVAIAALMMPMGALAATGYAFEKLEPQVRKGIEGLQVVAPTVIAILTPVMVLMYTLSHFKVSSEQLTRGFKDTAVGIALGLVLVTEALVLLNAPLLGLAILGSVYGGVKDATKQGIEAMKIVNEALMSLVPWIPVFIGGIALAALAFFAPEIGIPALAATALGIGVGLLAVTEAIVGLSLPLEALGQVGNNFPDLSSAKQGAEAMKITAEALGYVEEAMRDMTLVKWELLAGYVADLAGIQIGFNLTQLTATGGFFDQLNTFTKAFNQISIETPMPDKVEALKLAGSGISTIGDAMKSVKTALDNLPDEFKNQKTTMTYDAETDTTTVATTDVTGYFDQFKEPLKQLKTFIYDFNHSEDFNFEPIDTSKVANINSAAGMIEQLDVAVQRVKTVMGNIGDANWNASYAQGGVLAGIDSWLFGIVPGGSGSGNYKSSLGASLQSMEDVISDLFTFQSRVNSLGGGNGEGANVDTQTAFVQSISTMITTLADKLSGAVPTFKQHGNSLGTAIVTGFKGAIKNIPNVPAEIANKIMNTKDTLYNTVNSLGVTSVRKFKEAINPMSEVTGWELYYVNEKFTGEWYDKIGASAYNLGVHASNRYKEGLDMNSPGRMARATADEIGFIGQALQVNNLPQMAMDLGAALSNSFHFDLSNIQLPDVTAWTSKLGGLTSTVTGVKDKVSLDFRTIGVNVGSSLNNMKSATIKNIGNIKTSWRGMQDALIASAEHIRSKTTSKINTLKDNMASFWKKIKNPELLISGAAGGHTGTIKRRFASPSLKGHYAGGGTVSRSQSLFKTRNKGGGQPSDLIGEYLQCLLETGKPCYAGGWNFDWRNKIQKRFEGWNTHFNAYHLDDFLNVGKFSNSNFPVKGRADIAKQYIFDVISATTYGKYFNSHFGDDPVAALRAGVFNCWDGTNIVLAIARAFGFEGSRGHGTWNGIGHVWANIPGLGIIDPTAIQNRHSFTSSAVRGYSAGSINRHNTNSKVDYGGSKTINNTTEVHIHGNVYGVDDLDKKIEQGVNKANRKLFTNSMSGV